MTKITIPEGFDINPETLAHIEAYFYWPGEKIRINREVKFHHETPETFEARKKKFADRELLIAETFITPTDGNDYAVNYVFEGIEGIHNANAFMNMEGYEHNYGVLITRDNQTWLVPLSEDFENPVAGQPHLINAKMQRTALHCFNINGVENTVQSYLASHQDSPTVGEYYLIPKGDNHWEIDNSPWMTEARDKEIAAAEQAIKAYKDRSQAANDDKLEHQPPSRI